MRITSVRVKRDLRPMKPAEDGTRVLAMASIVLDDRLVISHIRVVESMDGRRQVSMPSRRGSDGVYKDVAYPLTEDLRTEIKHAILQEVDKE